MVGMFGGIKVPHNFRKRPPFGKILAERLACGDIPQIVHIMAGGGLWDRAQDPSAIAGGCAPLVLDDDWAKYDWPVNGCAVRLEVGGGSIGIEQGVEFARHLITQGASGVILWWLSREDGLPVVVWSDGEVVRLDLEDLRILLS